MEVAIPLFALSGLYLMNNQNKKKDETEQFTNQSRLPNTNVIDENYPVDPNENEKTSDLSVNNRYDNGGGVYTDKYFNRQTTSDNGTEYTSLSGNKVGSDYFEHNNMVPFFGGNLKNLDFLINISLNYFRLYNIYK